jgi:type I restriction enzyme S subunit
MLPNDKVLDRKYLAYFLRSKTFVGWVSSQTAGAKMPRVSMKVFWDYEIPLPPLAEQKRIAAILDKADNLRRKRQQAIQLADDFLRSVFLDMFGDPVTNPKGWEVRPLGESIAHANNGLSRRRKEFENLGEIVLRLQDVHYEGIHFDKVLNRIQLDTSEKQRFLVNEGDILFIRVNGNPDYVGRSSVFEGYTEDVYHNDHLIRIKVGGGYDPIFLSYCFNHEGGRKIIAGQIKTSAGQHTISQGGIGKLAFYLPPLTLQQRFVSIRNAVKSIPVAGDLPQDLFACLSQKAFAGEL